MSDKMYEIILVCPILNRCHRYVVSFRSVIDTKESDGIADPMEKMAIKSHSDHSDSGISKILILIHTYFVII